MTNIEKIDQACMETYQRYQGVYQNRDKIYEHLRYALNEGLNGNFSGFTRQNGSREQIMTLTKEEIEAELLKNLVRTVAYKRETNDSEYGKGTALFNLNEVTRQMPLYMVENGLSGVMLESNLNAESYDMERGQMGFTWMDFPAIRDAVVASFIHNRYERNINIQLNDSMLLPEEIALIDDIDAYSLRKQNGLYRSR